MKFYGRKCRQILTVFNTSQKLQRVYMLRSLLGCDAVYYGRDLQTFRRNELTQSSGSFLLFFHPENGGSAFLLNVSKPPPNNTVSRQEIVFFIATPENLIFFA
jgi:hypothetical protein